MYNNLIQAQSPLKPIRLRHNEYFGLDKVDDDTVEEIKDNCSYVGIEQMKESD
jgi:hypothetical protein